MEVYNMTAPWLHALKVNFFLRHLTDSFSICANSMASISTFQVEGRWPWPPIHLVSPSCTASSSFKGLAWMHAVIVDESSPTHSRTAFALPAAFLLTCILQSTRWSGRSAEITRPTHYRHPLQVMRIISLTSHT